jgi:hypothetical protein
LNPRFNLFLDPKKQLSFSAPSDYMKPIRKSYLELLQLTQLYLLREFSLQDFKTVDPSVHAFFLKKLKPRTPPSVPIKKIESTPIEPNLPPAPKPVPAAILPQKTSPSLPPPQPVADISDSPSSLSTPPKLETVIAAVPIAQKSSDKNQTFLLEPMQAPEPANFHELWKICPNIFPHWPLSKTILAPALPKKANLPVVIILAFNDQEPQLTFLTQIARAISLRLAPAQVRLTSQLEKENNLTKLWASTETRLIIAPDYGLYSQTQLMQYYRQDPQQGKHYLNQIPLLLLSDLSLYFKDPQLKSLLWRTICNEFAQISAINPISALPPKQ